MEDKKPNFIIAGIPIYIHWSILPMLGFLMITNVDSKIPLLPLITYPAILIIITLHELGHCFAARALGSSVKKITLTALGGLAEIGVMPITWKEAIITIAGPAVNVVIAIVGLPFIRNAGPVSSELFTKFTPSNTIYILWIMNLVILIFNLLPVYPMDGGRLWRCLIATLAGEKRSFQVVQFSNALLLAGVGWFCIEQGTFFMLAIVGLMALVGIANSRSEVAKFKFVEALGRLNHWKLISIESLDPANPNLNIVTLENISSKYIECFLIGEQKLYQILPTHNGDGVPGKIVADIGEKEKGLGIPMGPDMQELSDLENR